MKQFTYFLFGLSLKSSLYFTDRTYFNLDAKHPLEMLDPYLEFIKFTSEK